MKCGEFVEKPPVLASGLNELDCNLTVEVLVGVDDDGPDATSYRRARCPYRLTACPQLRDLARPASREGHPCRSQVRAQLQARLWATGSGAAAGVGGEASRKSACAGVDPLASSPDGTSKSTTGRRVACSRGPRGFASRVRGLDPFLPPPPRFSRVARPSARGSSCADGFASGLAGTCGGAVVGTTTRSPAIQKSAAPTGSAGAPFCKPTTMAVALSRPPCHSLAATRRSGRS